MAPSYCATRLPSSAERDGVLTTDPLEQLTACLADDIAAVNGLIRSRMENREAPRIPEVTAHLVEAGGKRVRPLLTLAAAQICGYRGEHHLR
ncbi:MAG TPA: polyprenyl synthetase family protein, partial [Paracoccaceae bacterium]|nr:polyprenyl synthetase family protein [Paracoccaceae bacterium]